MLDLSLKLSCELKPLFRKSGSLEARHHQSFEQTLGHLAKFVFQDLKLWGTGRRDLGCGNNGDFVLHFHKHA
jgi:hypothetical protein